MKESERTSPTTPPSALIPVKVPAFHSILAAAIELDERLLEDWSRRAWELGRPKELTVERQPIIAQDAIEWEI